MADTKTYISGHPIKLVDNNDGTFNIGVNSGFTVDELVSSLELNKLEIKDIPKYTWFTEDDSAPTPTEVFAWGLMFDKETGVIKVYGWAGDKWVEVD